MVDVLRADIVGHDMGASAALRNYGREADVAAAQTRRLAEAQDAQRRAAATAAAATIASAKADRILKDASDDAIRATVEQRIATEKLGKSSAAAAGRNGVGALAGGGGIGGGGALGALIAAGVALSPVLVTVGLGLGGLGLAALAAGKRSQQLKAELAPLKADFAAFGDAVRPTVLTDFAGAARLAGHVLHDLQPVTIATGDALAGVFAALDKMFASQKWQGFFQFMGKTAASDVRLLGTDLILLANDLPPLLTALQPLAVEILKDVGAVAKLTAGVEKAAGGVGSFTRKAEDSLSAAAQSGHLFGVLGDQTNNLAKSQHGLLHFLGDVIGGIFMFGSGTASAIPPVQHVTAAVNSEAKQLNILAASYEHALTPLENYISASLTEANDLHALRVALRASGDTVGYKTQKERDSFAAAQAYIQDTLKQGDAALSAHKGIDAQIGSIEKALPALEHVKGKTADYRAELHLLKDILDRLRQEKRIQETVQVSGQGTWRIGAGPFASKPVAAGWRVTGGVPGKDSVPLLAMPGELVVPTKMVAAGLVDHLRGLIPGFAAGGIVPKYSGGPAGLPPWTSHNQAATISALTGAIARAFASSMAGFGMPGPGGGAPAANAALARRMMPAWGSGAEWAAWNYVAMRESGWSQFARNPSSGAYGIPQALPPSKMGAAANPPMSNPAAQISWMIGYISGRYRDPLGAAAHERAFNWYGSGLRGTVFLQPTVIGVAEAGPERVTVEPLSRGTRTGPLVHIDNFNSYDATDPVLLGQRLSFAVTAASLGS